MLSTLRSWLGRDRLATRSRPAPARTRLSVESLEDRSVPSAAFDTTFGAGGAFQVGGETGDSGPRMARDAAGNFYLAGGWGVTTDLDPGPGTSSLTGQGQFDGFVAKYSPAGELIWARNFGGAQNDHGEAVAVDAAGNVFVGIRFDATADLDPDNAYLDDRDIVTGTGRCIARYNADGSFAWVWRDASAGGLTRVTDLAADGAGGVVACGDYGNPTSSWVASAAVKLDSQGALQWRKDFVSSTGGFVARAITLDGQGNVFLLAALRGSVDVNPGSGTLTLRSTNMSTVVEKLTAAGDFVWAQQMQGSERVEGYDIAVDGAGHVYTAGYFEKTADFDPGKGKYSLTAPAGGGTFVTKLTTAGNFVWARAIGAGDNVPYQLALDAAGGVYLAGSFDGSGDFNPGAGTHTLTSAGGKDGFVVKLDASGNFAWALRMGGTNINDSVSGLVVGDDGSVFVGGNFWQSADFGSLSLTSWGQSDIFVAKITQT